MRGRLASALFVAGILITAPIAAQAVGGVNSVTVTPGHGSAAAQFQVTYAISPCTQAAGLVTAFSWNGLTPAGQVLGTAATDSTCRATLTAKPPANAAAPGSYTIFGYVALSGGPAPDTQASTTYTVDVAPTATASSSASSSAASTPSASTPAGSAAASSAPAGSDQPGTAGTAGTAPSGHKTITLWFSPLPDWWTLSSRVVAGVGILALAVLAVLSFPLLARRRRAHPPSGASKDKAA
jgi:hypothetical protein